jgi:large subunit ribosomal protein L21
MLAIRRSASLPAASNRVQQAVSPLLKGGSKFAIVYCGNIQYKVSVGDVIAVQRLRAEVGSEISLKKVAMVGGPTFTAVGRPFLANCQVVATVEEQKRMRNVVSLFSRYGHRHTRWIDRAHAATILRVVRLEYEPIVVGEVNKYDGVLQPTESFDPAVSVNKTYWANELEAQYGNAYAATPAKQ